AHPGGGGENIPPPENVPPPKPQDLFGGITRRPPRKPAGPPTRERKLKAVSQQQLDAARALVKPQPPIKPGPKISFEADDTPADAEEILSKAAAAAPRVKRPWTDGVAVPKHPGPL